MGIFSAMTTAVAGLRAQSSALEHISDNIANSQTVGFKRTETSFVDMVSESQPGQQEAGSVMSITTATNGVQGDLVDSEIDTNIAISGSGYFVVSSAVGVTDGDVVFYDEDMYTRRGDFTLDKDGYLVNGAGYYLMGNTIDEATGNPTGGVPEVIQFSNDFLAAKQTTSVDYRLNLPTYPQTVNSDDSVTDSELLDASLIGGDITSDDAELFLKGSIAGGAVATYDESGNAVNVQMRWVKTDNTAGANVWNLYYLSDTSPSAGTDVTWTKADDDYVFDTDGSMTSPGSSSTITGLTVDGKTLGNIELSHGSGGITQYSDSNGTAVVNKLEQNGYSAGNLSSVTIGNNGRVSAVYTNGEVVELAQITLASFNAESQLQKQNGSAFTATAASGSAIYGATGTILSNQLEGSNTDIAEEFSKLIITQQAYAANTKIVTTSNEMLQEVINMKR